jgi:hypothetical protein
VLLWNRLFWGPIFPLLWNGTILRNLATVQGLQKRLTQGMSQRPLNKKTKFVTTANITIDRTLQKLREFGFSEALRETKVCPSTYFNLWFLCTYGSTGSVRKVLAKC